MSRKKKQNSEKSLPALTQLTSFDSQMIHVIKQDTSIYVPQRDKISKKLTIRAQNFTENQKNFLKIAMDKQTKIMFVSGPAGCSKTYVTIYIGLCLLNDRRLSDLIYVRSIVESADAKLGYLPGEADEKLAPYIVPLLEKLEEFLSSGDIKYLRDDNRVVGYPINYLRGLNWNAKFIVADESQNMSFKELTTLVTRVGEFSKLLILGDPQQSDLPTGKSGFQKMYDLFDDDESKQNGIFCFQFTEDDILRSDLVKYIVKKLKKENK